MSGITVPLPLLAPDTDPVQRRSDSDAAVPRPAVEGTSDPTHLIDAHGRTIRDLRLSVTDRCNFRCRYCMEPDARFLSGDRLLSAEELVRAASTCVDLGVRKIRLTGGEPTVRADLDDVIAGVAALPIDDLAMTTNGALVTRDRLARWRDLGLSRVTFSIDAADPGRFEELTRARTPVERVLDAVGHALDLGFADTKLNAVVLRGMNEDQIVPLAELARRFGIEMRFIEFMPLDGGDAWTRDALVPADEIRATIDRTHPLRPIGRVDRSATAERFAFADGAPGTIGLIAPVTRAFCGACNRLRLGADGSIRPCLFGPALGELRTLLRTGADDRALRVALAGAVHRKQAGHGIGTDDFARPGVAMNTLGG